ncbi:hypothetical protein [Amycolatopsis minnesotensis]|uniref:hypothetical protein n=1 Tax=Amycolatopsis minnesotensis TaxID=337894 RepID=UPI0031DB8404
MPKSKGRKPKPGKKNRPRTPPNTGGGRYRPGAVHVDEDEAFALLDRLIPEQVLTVGLPVWWLLLLPGKPANICLEGAFVLREAFALFGIDAKVKLVELIVRDTRTGQATQYGRPDPHFTGDQFRGHAGLWLPESKRFIDHSAQQFPPVRAVSWMPVSVRATSLGVTEWSAQRFGVPRGDHLMLEYTPVDDTILPAIMNNSTLAEHMDQVRRAGVNLASNLLAALRLPKLRERALASPHERLHRLLDLVGDADLINDPGQDHRFLVSGHPGGIYLDEIAATLPG